MQAPHIDLLASLVEQQERTRLARSSIRRAIEKLQKQDAKLRDHEIGLQNQIHEQRIYRADVPLPTNAAPSPKNLDFLRSWSALHSELTKSGRCNRLSQNSCREVIRRVVHGIPDSTIRSHLHRLKAKGLIENIGGSWQLASESEHDVTAGHIQGCKT